MTVPMRIELNISHIRFHSITIWKNNIWLAAGADFLKFDVDFCCQNDSIPCILMPQNLKIFPAGSEKSAKKTTEVFSDEVFSESKISKKVVVDPQNTTLSTCALIFTHDGHVTRYSLT